MNARLFVPVARGLFVAAVPLAVVLTTVRLMVFDADYYRRGYERHQVGRTTGLSPVELAEVTAQVQGYFRGGPPVSLVVQKEWSREPLFNAREQRHLADVRELMALAWRVQEVALAALVGLGAGLLFVRGAGGARRVARWLAAGAGLTLGIFAVLGLLALGDFESLWTQFHLLSFNNDLWLLDPATDYMIRLWPVPFWFEAVTDLVIRSLGAAVGLLVLALAYLRWGPRRLARAAVAQPAPPAA